VDLRNISSYQCQNTGPWQALMQIGLCKPTIATRDICAIIHNTQCGPDPKSFPKKTATTVRRLLKEYLNCGNEFEYPARNVEDTFVSTARTLQGQMIHLLKTITFSFLFKQIRYFCSYSA
jgi:hypothetical protein